MTKELPQRWASEPNKTNQNKFQPWLWGQLLTPGLRATKLWGLWDWGYWQPPGHRKFMLKQSPQGRTVSQESRETRFFCHNLELRVKCSCRFFSATWENTLSICLNQVCWFSVHWMEKFLLPPSFDDDWIDAFHAKGYCYGTDWNKNSSLLSDSCTQKLVSARPITEVQCGAGSRHVSVNSPPHVRTEWSERIDGIPVSSEVC